MTEIPAGQGSEETVRRYFDTWNTGDTTVRAATPALVWLVRMRAGRMAEMWTYRQVRPDR